MATVAGLGGVLTMLAGVLMAHTVELDGPAGKSQDVAQAAHMEKYGALAALLLGESATWSVRLCSQCRWSRALMLLPQGTRRVQTSGFRWELQPP